VRIGGAEPRIPKAIAEAPEVEPDLELYWVAFWRLSSTRQVGMGLGPISWMVVESYCDSLGLHGEDREEMHAFVSALDHEYLAWHDKKARRHGDS